MPTQLRLTLNACSVAGQAAAVAAVRAVALGVERTEAVGVAAVASENELGVAGTQIVHARLPARV